MTTRPWERRDAEAFADALDARAVPGQELDTEVARLVHVAEALCRAEVAEPRPEFAQDLRARLMDEATTTLAPAPARRVVHVQPITPPPRSRRLRRLGAVAATLALVGGSFGLVSTSAQALPGEMLYPVKRGVENTQLVLERGPSASGSARLGLARERLEEVKALAAENDDARTAELVDETLQDFSTQAEQGSGSLLRSYAEHQNPRTVHKVTTFTQSASRTLAALAATLPESADGSYAEATTVLEGLNSSVGQACPQCEVPSLAGLPRSLTAQLDHLAGSVGDGPGGDDSVGAAPKGKARTGKHAGSQPGNDDRSAAEQSSPSESLPEVDVPKVTGDDDGDAGGGPAPDLSQPVEKATDPVKKLLDPVVQGLLGTGDSTSGKQSTKDGSGSQDSGGSGGTDDDAPKGLVPSLLDGLTNPK